jgi:hypothetical protein
MLADSTCVSGCGDQETAAHLFCGCNIFSSLWNHILLWFGLSVVLPGDIRQHLFQFTHLAGLPRVTHHFLTVIWFASVWAIWKERNNRIFQDTASDSSIIAEKVKLNSFMWLKSSQTSFIYDYHDWWKNPLPCMGLLV